VQGLAVRQNQGRLSVSGAAPVERAVAVQGPVEQCGVLLALGALVDIGVDAAEQREVPGGVARAGNMGKTWTTGSTR
jgi:hypothetical protein